MSAPNRNVAWIKQQEPSFLKAFKAKVGYREPDTIEAKKAKVTPGGEGGGGSDEERDDELPTVVVLQKGDIEEEEYHKFRETMKEIEKKKEKDGGGERVGAPTVENRPQLQPTAEPVSEDDGGKILFKRPVKRRRSSEGVLDASTKKTKDQGGGGARGKGRSPRSRKGSSSGVKNSSLLSFDDEEDV